MKIPLVDLQAQYAAIRPEIDAAIARVLTKGDFIQGEDVGLLEREFAAYCGATHAIGVSSGTSALQLALMALDIGPGAEVITTPFTFIATAEAISHVGATPVFADIDPLTCNLSPARVEDAITPRTKAIIAVHLYGRPADMAPLMEIAERYGLKVIEDAAQAHGAVYRGARTGSLGHCACFSFYPGKNLGAYGDAGMVTTNDPETAQRLRLLRDHGRRDKYEHLTVGYNGRLDTLQAAIVRAKLKHLDDWNQRRRDWAKGYSAMIAGMPFVRPPEDSSESTSAHHLYVLRSDRRDAVLRSLQASGIGAGVHYPIPLHLQPAYRHLGYAEGAFPESERASREVFSLPLYPEMTEEQAQAVVTALEEAARVPAPA